MSSRENTDKVNKYNIYHLKVSLEEILFKITPTNRKDFSLWQRICMMNVLYSSLSKQFGLSISSRNPIKTQPEVIFARVQTAKCNTVCTHDDSLEDYYCFPFLRSRFLIPTLHLIFNLSKPLNSYIDVPLLFGGIAWENMHFYALKKVFF